MGIYDFNFEVFNELNVDGQNIDPDKEEDADKITSKTDDMSNQDNNQDDKRKEEQNTDTDTHDNAEADPDEPTDDDNYSLDDGDDTDSNNEADPDEPTDDDNYSLDDGEDGENNSTEDDSNSSATDGNNYSMGDNSGDDGDEIFSKEGSDNDTDNSADDNSNDGDSHDADNTLEKVENDIFSELTPEQMEIKKAELKGNFSKLYDDCETYIDKVNRIDKNEDSVEVLEKIMSSLLSLKNYLYKYITETFNTKTYTENQIIYQKIIACLSAICNVLAELAQSSTISIDNK